MITVLITKPVKQKMEDHSFLLYHSVFAWLGCVTNFLPNLSLNNKKVYSLLPFHIFYESVTCFLPFQNLGWSTSFSGAGLVVEKKAPEERQTCNDSQAVKATFISISLASGSHLPKPMSMRQGKTILSQEGACMLNCV